MAINENVVLNFDPYYVDEIHVDIFNDDIARTLYLGIKQAHIVDQHFNQNCLDIARLARSIAGKLDGRIFFRWLLSCGMVGSNEREFANELLPYVLPDLPLLEPKVIGWSQATATQRSMGHP